MRDGAVPGPRYFARGGPFELEGYESMFCPTNLDALESKPRRVFDKERRRPRRRGKQNVKVQDDYTHSRGEADLGGMHRGV